MIKDFRDFVLRGNVVDLAVAVVLGAAFGVVVTALTSSFITPLIAAVGGESDFSRLAFTINGSKFTYGVFVNALIAFLLLAAVVFFLIVRPLNTLMARMRSEAPEARVTKPCSECLSEIPTQARRCAFCTAEVGAAGAG
jgi:large conductance mechanosensitive channel